MPINSWSYSSLAEFEKCAFRAYLKYDQRIPEPQRELPPGKTEHANDRGTRIHTAAEMFVQSKGPFIPEMKKFEAEFITLQQLYKQGKVSLEGEWAVTDQWEPVAWGGEWKEGYFFGEEADNEIKVVKKLPQYGRFGDVVKLGKKLYGWMPAWHRSKIDAMVTYNEGTSAVVIDYKSGKKFGNEIKHGEQVQLYQLNAFMRYPHLEEVVTELWYLDVDDITRMKFTRDQGLRFKRSFDIRGNKMVNATTFPANPNKFSCQYCMYSNRPDGGTSQCTVGVDKAGRRWPSGIAVVAA